MDKLLFANIALYYVLFIEYFSNMLVDFSKDTGCKFHGTDI